MAYHRFGQTLQRLRQTLPPDKLRIAELERDLRDAHNKIRIANEEVNKRFSEMAAAAVVFSMFGFFVALKVTTAPYDASVRKK